jgi:hypothetical protein
MFTATQGSNLLRWSRRVVTAMLIISNFAAVMLADAASTTQDRQPSFSMQAAADYFWFSKAGDQPGFKPTNPTSPPDVYYGRSQIVIEQPIAAIHYGVFNVAVTGLNAMALSLVSRANASPVIITTR